MILISEVVHPGEVHLEINSSLLDIIFLINPNEPIIYRGEDNQVNGIRGNIELSDKIKFISYNKYYDPKAYSWSIRILGEIKQIYKSLKLGHELKVNNYIWTSLFPTGHLFLNFCLLFCSKNVKHLIVLHSDLEYLKTINKKKSEVFLGKVLKIAIKLSRKNTKYLVLGDSIKSNLRAYISPSILERVIAVLHPYRYNENINTKEFFNNSKTITFGSIGIQMISKNSNWIFKLAECLEEEIIKKNLDFVTIGKVLPEIIPFENKLVKQLHANSFVPQSVFEEQIKALDFVVFFYDNNSYQLCASGAVFEAIRLGLPIISIYNDYFGWLFEKYGKMGFLCDNLQEMCSLILRINARELDTEINGALAKIAKFKTENNLETIAKELVMQL